MVGKVWMVVIMIMMTGAMSDAWGQRPARPLSVRQAEGVEHAGKAVRVAGFVGCVRASRWCLLFAEPEGLVESMMFDAAALPAADHARAVRCGLGSSEPRCPAVLSGRMRVVGDGSDVTLGVSSVTWGSR